MNLVFEHGPEFIDNNILNNFLRLIYENFTLEGPDFGVFIMTTYLETI